MELEEECQRGNQSDIKLADWWYSRYRKGVGFISCQEVGQGIDNPLVRTRAGRQMIPGMQIYHGDIYVQPTWHKAISIFKWTIFWHCRDYAAVSKLSSIFFASSEQLLKRALKSVAWWHGFPFNGAKDQLSSYWTSLSHIFHMVFVYQAVKIIVWSFINEVAQDYGCMDTWYSKLRHGTLVMIRATLHTFKLKERRVRMLR
jgi:hypothetical protein